MSRELKYFIFNLYKINPCTHVKYAKPFSLFFYVEYKTAICSWFNGFLEDKIPQKEQIGTITTCTYSPKYMNVHPFVFVLYYFILHFFIICFLTFNTFNLYQKLHTFVHYVYTIQ